MRTLRGVVVLSLVAATGCVRSSAVVCGDGRVCPGDEVCDDVHGGCVVPQQLEVCDGRPDGEPCMYPGETEATCRDGVCLPGECGNGTLDVDEACDEGEANSSEPGAACRPTCQLAGCGDMVVDPGEACDDGNQVAGDGCSIDCGSDETCGNGVTDFTLGEQCDDGDLQSHDGCQATCQIETLTWQIVIDPNNPPTTPGPLQELGMVFDPVRGRSLLVGGRAGSGQYRDTTWEWDGLLWRWAGDVRSPTARLGHGLAADMARGQVVLFGGNLTTVSSASDTWVWNGRHWTLRSPPSSPPGRAFHAMAYDARRRRVVLFGGIDTAQRADTWEWDGLTWVDVTPTSGSPSARSHAAMTYDPVRGRVVLFGGDASGVAQADTWEWDGATWVDVTPMSGSPPARAGAQLVHDVARGQLVLVGGAAGGVDLDDTWTWSGLVWTDRTPPTLADRLPARRAAGAAYDIVRERVVVHGGGQGGSTLLQDTREWDGVRWQLAPSMPAQPTLSNVAMTYDSRRGQLLMFGGAFSTVRDDLWAWTGSHWRLVAVTGPKPPARRDALLAYDARRDRVVLFGGSTGSVRLADTWEWNGTSWIDVTPALSPAVRSRSAMAYDAVRGVTVLFGGQGANTSDRRGDVWEWNGTTWTERTPASGGPQPRSGHGMVYDARCACILMVGGETGTSFLDYRSDVWEWNGTSWTPRIPQGGSPPGRQQHALVYDSVRARTLMFGGEIAFAPFDDLWEWDGTAWHDVTPSLGSPGGRYAHVMGYDPSRARTVLYGGVGGPYQTWTLRHDRAGTPVDGCAHGGDGDLDGAIGCADPDCFGVCSPWCNPTETLSCDMTLPRCGDSICQDVESRRLCPSDCGAPIAACGDFACDAPETTASCPGDCP